jgi:hypothetical protein
MKKIIPVTAIVFALVATTTVMAQTTAGAKDAQSVSLSKQAVIKMEHESRKTDIRFQSRQQFNVDFPSATDIIFWQSNGIDVISFTQNKIQCKAYYDADSKLIGTVTPKTIADIPANALAHIRKNYKDFSIDKVIFFDDNEFNESDIILYGQTFNDADNYFAELSKGGKKFVVKIAKDGAVSFFDMM